MFDLICSPSGFIYLDKNIKQIYSHTTTLKEKYRSFTLYTLFSANDWNRTKRIIWVAAFPTIFMHFGGQRPCMPRQYSTIIHSPCSTSTMIPAPVCRGAPSAVSCRLVRHATVTSPKKRKLLTLYSIYHFWMVKFRFKKEEISWSEEKLHAWLVLTIRWVVRSIELSQLSSCLNRWVVWTVEASHRQVVWQSNKESIPHQLTSAPITAASALASLFHPNLTITPTIVMTVGTGSTWRLKFGHQNYSWELIAFRLKTCPTVRTVSLWLCS